MAILQLRDVRYTYQTQYQKVEALKGINHAFDSGKVHAIVGRSGSGKTTLLSLMAGLDLPTGGEVICEGVSTAALSLDRYRLSVLSAVSSAHCSRKCDVSHGAAGNEDQSRQGKGRPADRTGGSARVCAGSLSHHAVRR